MKQSILILPLNPVPMYSNPDGVKSMLRRRHEMRISKMYIIGIAKDMDFKDLPFCHQLELGNVIIQEESYIAGFPKPIMTAHHFHKLWLKLENATRNDPS